MKRNLYTRYTLLVLTFALLLTGCTKNFEKINTNPTSYTKESFDPNYTLTTAQLTYTGSTDFSYDTWRGNLIYASTMSQGFSTVLSYWAGDKYTLNEAYTAAYWGNSAVGAYFEQVKPIVDVVEATRGVAKYNNLHQIARIWKALIFQRLTDLYGDVPYSEAGQGYYTSNFLPKYDKQQDIYTDLLKEVDEATNALQAGGDNVTGDVIYKGDIDKWKRFGNSLLLRMAMRLVKVDETTARTYAQKAVGKTMADNSDNAIVMNAVSGARVTQNRNSQVLLGDGGQENYYVKWSATFINALKAANDPRLEKVAVTKLYLTESGKVQNSSFITAAASQKGQPNGKDLSGVAARDIRQDASYTSFTDYSSPHPGMIKRDGNTFILTYAQTELLWAEAAQRWSIGGSAADHYAKGVSAAISYLSQYDAAMAVSATAADAFAATQPYNAANGLQLINTQYWLLCNTMFDFYETWINWRRSGYPALTPVVYPANATNGTIPRRFPYPANEAAYNNANYKAAADAVPGGDNLSGRVWWDKL